MLIYILGVTGILGLIAAIYSGIKVFGFYQAMKDSAVNKERVRQLQIELDKFKKATEIIIEPRTQDDVSDKLDKGNF